MTTEVTEFVVGEVVTATIHMTAISGVEAYQGPLHIGFYKSTDEVFLENEGHRINIPAHLMKPILAQIKRAAKIALEQPE